MLSTIFKKNINVINDFKKNKSYQRFQKELMLLTILKNSTIINDFRNFKSYQRFQKIKSYQRFSKN